MNGNRPRLDGSHLTLGLGLLYLFGFVVANVHFGRYELPNIELLRARYLAAALLFILCSAIPFAVGAFLSRALRTRPDDETMRTDLKLGETEAWAMGPRAFFYSLVLAVALHAMLVSRITIRPFAALGTGALYFIVASMLAWQLCDSLLGGRVSDEAQIWPPRRAPRRVIVLCAWVLVVPFAFSAFLYGSIQPALGGGALWKARLTWRSTADSSARAIASGIVAIVDRDEHTLNLIACAQTGPPVSISVPAAEVSSIQLGALVSPSSFLENYRQDCRRIDSDHEPISRRTLLALMLGLSILSTYLLYKVVLTAK